MRRQTMQCFFTFLIMLLSINLNFSSANNENLQPISSTSASNSHGKDGSARGRPGPSCKSQYDNPPRTLHEQASCSSEPAPPSTAPVPSPSPPPPPTPMHPPPPPPSTGPPAKERVSPSGSQNVGKFVGLVFLGIAGVLQVGVVSFLVFNRWQINGKYCKLALSPSWSSRDGR